MKKILLLTCLLMTAAMPVAAQQAVISLIIDDLGNDAQVAEQALQLPGPIAYAILPGTPYDQVIALRARDLGKQVMLHIPMEAEHDKPLGPKALTSNMSEVDFKAVLQDALATVPNVAGLNNHMGSLLTQNADAMRWVMQVLKQQQLFFVDSRTSAHTVAESIANETGVRAMRRDVFLDHSREPKDIARQYRRLLQLAQRQGWATGIAHPYPETIEFLKFALPQLEQNNIRLVFASEMYDIQRSTTWAESSSPSHKVAKNWKP
ncbi:MAG: divergent polysaccharide deacetylase family protein [Chromatiales bacterium]|jgi:polysaccharide deacetylase 2 family uncharacterized protein YibQ